MGRSSSACSGSTGDGGAVQLSGSGAVTVDASTFVSNDAGNARGIYSS